MLNEKQIKSEKGLRTMILRNLNKEIHPGTKPSMDFICKILNDAYDSGMKYDVSNMRNSVLAFAASSTNQADYCIKLVNKIHFKSDEVSEPIGESEQPIVFFDIEVFPNLLLVNWKKRGKDSPIIRMINPTPSEIEKIINFRLIGFNCRRYDNHILYGRLMGYDNEQIYNLSQKIISGNRDCFFGEAYNLSYTDVYDFASDGNKKSLKKFEIELGIHHQELGIPWDEPVDEDLWTKVSEYCDNDVIATEAVFEYLTADWTARQILAELAGMTVNDTTNSLTTRIIFNRDRNPQRQFKYRDLSKPFHDLDEDTYQFLVDACPKMMEITHGEDGSFLPYFPGYRYESGKSTYRDEVVGEGGYVYSEPGMYGNVALLDIASMHPHTVISECLFGIVYTTAFQEIVKCRVNIKHENWDVVNSMLDGKLIPFVQKVMDGEMTSKQLANALKTAINSVYGLTSARFDNAFRDNRNVDNIVAKRGALFMIDLKHEVQKKGFIVAHIKTDSIKIPDATPEIIQFVKNFGEKYGYFFEHEATYDRMCLVNDAVYIAKYKDGGWTATGKQFQIPYVYKTLFSKEPIEFQDMCETKSVKTALYLDMNEDLSPVDILEKVKVLRNFSRDLLSRKDERILSEWQDISDQELDERIAGGHAYHFVGKVGQFCPIKEGFGGGELLRTGKDREGNFRLYAVGGSKGYRWMESEMVKILSKEECIDRSYYDKMVTDAVETIASYGNYSWFVSEEPYVSPKYVNGVPVYKDSIIN